MQAMSTAASSFRRLTGAALEALLLLAIAAALIFGLATVTGGGPLGASAIRAASKSTAMTLSVPDGTFGGTTTATMGGGSTAKAATTTSSTLWLYAVCYKSDDTGIGLTAWEPMNNGAATILLGPTPSWTSGGANCTASAGSFDRNGAFKASTKTSFSVSG